MHETDWRQPGRFQKISDKHKVDFFDFLSANSQAKHKSPHRAIRAVLIKELPLDELPGTLPIDDNNQETSFQFSDNNGWNNFVPHHVGELKQAVLVEKKR